MGDDEEEEAIDELDRANFQSKGKDHVSGSKKSQVFAVSAAEFHPHIMLDEIHEEFVEEIRSGSPRKDVIDQEMKGLERPNKYILSPACASVVPMSVHLDYCSEQLSRFEMVESDEEEGDMMPEIQCLPKDLAAVMGSAKRSLLDTLEKETGQKKKSNTGKSTTWGPVLINKPNTRNHGGIKIMDKAVAYMQKKNLEIPTSFRGPVLKKCKMHSYQAGYLSKPMKNPLQRCSDSAPTKVYQTAGQELLRIAWR